MKKLLLCSILAVAALQAGAVEREYLWTKRNMPCAQGHQIAAMLPDAEKEGFKADKNRIPYLEWFDAPADSVRNGACMILISGGGYYNTCDVIPVKMWHDALTAAGVQCVSLVYRTPRPEGLPFYRTAWVDGQRAVRMVRSEAAKRGYDPERIGVISMSAGSHLALLLATSSQTAAYSPVDKIDDVPCHINWGVLHAPAYATTDGLGIPATRDGYGPDVKLDTIFHFDAKTCPLSLHHGEDDVFTPMTSTLVYRELRKKGVPAELHLYPGKGHGVFGIERGVEFIRQMDFLGALKPEEQLMDRFAGDDACAKVVKEDIWPEGMMPDRQDGQCLPYIEWYFPKELKTTAIQIIYSGGGYYGNDPYGFEVSPKRKFLNGKGMTVVTLKYRCPRPSAESGLAKHTTAWQDVQRAVRLVRSKAASYGLDPDRIGIMGCSAGGHLTLMGVTSSLHRSYWEIDDIDKLPCNVQWGVAFYPAYALTDGADGFNTTGGNDDSAILVPEFSFDLNTAPTLFLHGDADKWAAVNSVKCWEKMRAMGVQAELHTFATRDHCFQMAAAPGTGSYNFLDRISDFLEYLKVLPE